MVPYWALSFLLFISMICPSALRFVKCLCTQMIPFCFVPDLTLKSSKTIWISAWIHLVNGFKWTACFLIPPRLKPCYLELILNCPNKDFDITFHGQSLKRVNMFTYLGIIFDETISWAPYIQYILPKAGKRLGMLSRLQRDLTCHAANTLYLSFIHPIFDYGDTVGNCCGVGNARLLDNFQRRASKIVSISMDSTKL